MLKLMVSALLVAQAAAFGLKSSLVAKTRSGSSLQMKLGENLRNAAASAVIAAAALNLGPGIASAETEVRQGMYKEYTIEKKSQQYDNAASGFKSKEETASGKNRYVAVLGVLVVGSFIIPMAQYWWYIKDDEPLQ